MKTTLVLCKSSAMLAAVVYEMTDWTDDFIVRPRALEIIVPQSSIFGVRKHLNARSINVDNLTFYETEDEDDE